MTEAQQAQEYNIGCSYDFSFLKGNDKFSDCEIKIGDRIIRSHRVLLSGCSKILEQKFSAAVDGANPTSIELTNISADSFDLFLNFLYEAKLSLTLQNVIGLIRVAHELEIKALFDVCSEFIDSASSTRTILYLLQNLSFALNKLPNIVKLAASLIEVLSNETDFGFLKVDEFKLLLSRSRFTSNYVRDDLIRKYISATGEENKNFDEFSNALAGAVDDTIQRTAFSAVFICSPPDSGLLRSMSSQIVVTSSGQLNGRDPSTIIEENPIKHWFTESDGNAWVLIEFTELYIQPTDYAIWSHGGASTLRNWCFQGSNDRQSWVILSTHRDDESIRMPFSRGEYPINTNGFFKYFRILQTGNNWAGNRWLYLMKIEMWGVACQMDNP